MEHVSDLRYNSDESGILGPLVASSITPLGNNHIYALFHCLPGASYAPNLDKDTKVIRFLGTGGSQGFDYLCMCVRIPGRICCKQPDCSGPVSTQDWDHSTRKISDTLVESQESDTDRQCSMLILMWCDRGAGCR